MHICIHIYIQRFLINLSIRAEVRLSVVLQELQRDRDDGRQLTHRRGVILLHPHESPQDVVPISRPAVHVRVLEPGWHVTLSGTGKEDGDEPEVPAAILNELILQLLVDVDGVKGPLVTLQGHVSTCYCLVIPGTDDYDDQVVFLANELLHEVNFADASELLFKHINPGVKAIVTQQGHKLDDLIYVSVTVCLIRHKHLPVLQ